MCGLIKKTVLFSIQC